MRALHKRNYLMFGYEEKRGEMSTFFDMEYKKTDNVLMEGFPAV